MQTSNQDILQYIMIGVLLLCGYLFLYQMAARKTENKNNLPFIAIILLMIYLIISVPLLFIIRSMGSTSMILIALLLLLTCVMLFIALNGLVHHIHDINKGMLALFLTYVLAVGYVTIFARDGTNDTSIFLFRFDMIQEAIRARSIEPLNHLLLNIAMFVPLGFLFPAIYPEKLKRLSYAVILGIICTTIIETVQMLSKLGQADLTDVVTNVAGAIIGYLIFKLFMRFRKPEEEE